MVDTSREFLPQVRAAIADFIPICRQYASNQRYAISVGGSLGKGTWDAQSDVDFRLYTDIDIPTLEVNPVLWKEYLAAIERWKARGVIIDGIWPRSIGEIDAGIDDWCSGNIRPEQMDWTIWGYYLLPDMYYQAIIEDPYHIISAWKERLRVYPPRLKQAGLDTYLATLHYWRNDHHYASKVERGDVVFTAGMSARLVHEVMQVLFALNETYYVGDGSNLEFARSFSLLPPDFPARVEAILYPLPPNPAAQQYARLCSLIDDVFALAGM